MEAIDRIAPVKLCRTATVVPDGVLVNSSALVPFTSKAVAVEPDWVVANPTLSVKAPAGSSDPSKKVVQERVVRS